MHRVLFALVLASLPNLNHGGKAHVLVFLRIDCPLAGRYAPELRRIAGDFGPKGVDFWLVYPDRSTTDAAIRDQMREFGLPGKWVRDNGQLIREAHATISPEAAVFDTSGKLVYHGRIDNRWVDFGKSRPAATEHDLEEALAAVVAGKPVPHAQAHAVGCSLADVE